MTLCTTAFAGGINIDCLSYISPLDNVIVTESDVSFTEAQLKLLSQWKTKIQQSLNIWLPSMIEGYERTSDEPTVNTLQTGRKVMVRKPAPSGMFYMRSNICDYNEAMRGFNGGTYRMFFVLADNTIVGHRDPNSDKVMGFQAEINAVTGGVPLPDAVENSFPLHAHFMNYKEFESQYAYSPNWIVQNELPPAMPKSYSARFISGTQATATIVAYINIRCGDAVTTITTADIEVIESTLTDDTVAGVTDNGDGTWDIEFTTAALNQYVTWRVKEMTGSDVDAVSNPVYHEFIA